VCGIILIFGDLAHADWRGRLGSLECRPLDQLSTVVLRTKTWEEAMKVHRTWLTAAVLVSALALTPKSAVAQKKYGPGVDDTEIKVGNIMPYSGPLSAYGAIGKTQAAYFNKINDEGGINGRKINFISYDDGFNPSKTVEQARKLVESDEVLLIFQSLGTPTNTAIQRYMNEKKVPQLFVATGATKWNDPKHFPWTMGWQPNYQSEARIYAKFLLQNHQNGRIGILYQNDDSGRDYVKGLKDGLGGRMPIVSESPYEVSDPTIDSQVISLKTSGADIFFNHASPKFAAQAIRKVVEIGWHPVQVMTNVSTSLGAVLKPAGLQNAKGILSTAYLKDPTDPAWKVDADLKQWADFMDQYYPSGDRTDTSTVYGYLTAQTLVQVLEQCGHDLSRENVMKQAANLKDLHLGMLLPDITINTGPTDFAPIEQMQMMRFNGESWDRFGPVITGEAGGT
jgi:branched-chain amino acid transport system substrate-binding protein